MPISQVIRYEISLRLSTKALLGKKGRLQKPDFGVAVCYGYRGTRGGKEEPAHAQPSHVVPSVSQRIYALCTSLTRSTE